MKTARPMTALLVGLSLVAIPANASIIETYSSASALENAAESPFVMTFEGTPEGPYSTSSPLYVSTTYGTVSMAGYWNDLATGTNMFVRQDPSPTWTGNYAEGPYGSPSLQTHIRAYMPPGILFFGANVMLVNGGIPVSGLVEIRALDNNDNIIHSETVNAVATTGQTGGYANATFIGFHSDTPVAQWRIYSRGNFDYIVVDNIYLAQDEAATLPPETSDAPDPATLLLSGGGIFLIALRHRWRRRSSEEARPLPIRK